MPDSTPDHVAREHAQKALDAIASHERICELRWDHSKESTEAVRRGIEGLYDRLATMQASIVAVQSSQLSDKSRLKGALGMLTAVGSIGAAIGAIIASLFSGSVPIHHP